MSAEKLAHAIKGEPFECPNCERLLELITLITKSDITWFKWNGVTYTAYSHQESDWFEKLAGKIRFFHLKEKGLCIFNSNELEQVLSLED